MKNIGKMLLTLASVAAVASCADCNNKKKGDFKYLVDEFADIKIMRYQIPGWEKLTAFTTSPE